MGEWALNCISWGLVPWERTDVQGPLQVPRVHITSQNKPLHGSVSPVGAQPPPGPARTHHLTSLLLIMSQVVVALQNTFPLSCLSLWRAWSLINPPPAGFDPDRVVLKALVTREGHGTSYTAEEQSTAHGRLWVHPKGTRLPQHPTRSGELLLDGTIQLSARRPCSYF